MKAKIVKGVVLWFALSMLAGFASCARMRIDGVALPSDAQAQWALAFLSGATDEDAPETWQGPGPNVFTAWREGAPYRRYIGDGDLAADVHAAREAFAGASETTFTIELGLGEGPLVLGIPYLRELALVPLREGLVAELEGERRVLSPEELRAAAAYDGGIPTPIPDLAIGADILGLVGRLARDLGVERDELLDRGEVHRYRSHTISAAEYPRSVPVNEETLQTAVMDAAEFLLRHQTSDGMYTYVYDGRSGTAMQEGYNIPRHSGSSYFLAQVDRVIGSPRARAGSLSALRWIEQTHLTTCGEHSCVVENGRADVGSAALTVVAAAEILLKAEDPTARRLVEELSGFLRGQQREDGELMHEYDLEANEPVDVQYLYYSGEAAFALMRAYEATGDERNVEAVTRLMTHLTGASWDFLGSRYYYGEEHWTCIAAGDAREHVHSPGALDFCQRWYEWNDVLQFREGQTPWPVEGAYGVGPVVVPRLTPVGSRTEAFIGTYLLMRDAQLDTSGVRALVERGLGQLLRYRWAPGPVHLLANPQAAYGAVPGSPVDLTSRNDFTQHAGSSWIRWLEILREEADPAFSAGTAGESAAPAR